MAKNVWDHFGNNISRDLLDFAIGARLGGGVGREVFVYAVNPEFVLKIETAELSWQNIMEWEVWHEAAGTPAEKWLAPCVRISANGKVLMQRRTQPLGWEHRPKRMPRFFTDFKITNYGTIDGHVVAHDYGVNMILRKGLSCQMSKVKWWQENDGASDS